MTGRRKRSKKVWRNALEDTRNAHKQNEDLFDYFKKTCTAYEMIVHTIDFQHQQQEIKLWISREDLWKILYPLSLGIYIAFLAIPAYDPVCTICFCAGIFLKAVIVESRRGYYWSRTASRKVLLAAIVVMGIFKIVMLFVCGYMAMLENTNQGWERHETWKMEMMGVNLNTTHETSDNSTTDSYNVTDMEMLDTILDDNGLLHDNLDRQYVHWFVHAYPAKCWIWWFLSFYAGPLLECMPTSVRMPVVLEKSQMPTSSVALSALFIVLGVTRSSVFDFVQIQSAMGDVYLLFGAPCIWACVFCLCHGIREKSSLGLTLPLSFISLCKSFSMLRADFWVQQNAQIFVVSAFSYIVYFFMVVFFLRAENVAIRSGWGTRTADVDGLSEDEEFTDLDNSKPMEAVLEQSTVIEKGKFSVNEDADEVRCQQKVCSAVLFFLDNNLTVCV
jgi:hypothetical protein